VEIIFCSALMSDDEQGRAGTDVSIEAAPYTYAQMGIVKAYLPNLNAFECQYLDKKQCQS